MAETKRGKHGCHVHVDRASSDGRNWRPVKCSRHHAPMLPPTPESPTGVPGTVCSNCGATVVRTRGVRADGTPGNWHDEVWTL